MQEEFLMTDTVTIASLLRSYINENILFGDDTEAYDDDDSFLETGILDSFGVMQLVAFVEEQFNIEVPTDEVTPSNFDSVNQLKAYVQTKMNLN